MCGYEESTVDAVVPRWLWGTVPVAGGRRRERNEAFFVSLSSASKATIGDAQGG